MRHLRCLCFVRPSPESIQSLIEELRDPKYGEYNICGFYQAFHERLGI
jgi:vacuolar protein sorting-associated protein 45